MKRPGSRSCGAAIAIAALGTRLASAAPPPADPLAAQAAFEQALAARGAGDFAGYRSGLERAAELLPDPTRLLYRLAAARHAAGDRAGALAALRRQLDAGFLRDPRRDPELGPMVADPAIAPELSRFDDLARPLGASRELFRLAEGGLLVEGLAHDPAHGDWYLSAVNARKIVRRAADGSIRDFVRSGAGGLAAPLALAVDGERSLLWVVSAGLPQAAGLPVEALDRSALLAFDLTTGALRHRVESPPGKHLWNDLAADGAGGFFVSDPGAAAIVRVLPTGTVTTLVEGRGLASPGGLALAEDGEALFVADWTNGLARLDLAAGELAWLAPPPGSTVLGIDGLARRGELLVAIQNGVPPARITTFRLATDGRSLASAELLERGVQEWDEPTLGVVAGGDWCYVADSHWPRFGEDGKATDPAALTPAAVRCLPLPASGPATAGRE